MKTLKTLLVIILVITSLSSCIKKEDPEPSTTACKAMGYTYDQSTLTYDLVWAEEFDGTAVNLDNWTYETGGSGWGNNELQYYTNGLNSTVKDGLLNIEIRKESFEGKNYTSSRMISRNKADFLYGKIDVYAKMPENKGSWAAVWMMPTSSSAYGPWPNSGEIDIVEYVGYAPDRVYGTVHTASYNHKKGTQRGFDTTIKDADTFHLYTVEWLPDQIRFYIDGKFMYRFAPGLFLNCPTSKAWPFDRKFFLIVNTAVGGDWGGAQGIAETGWPQNMQVDYIRVYQSPQMPAILATKK
ncbi:MAG: Glucan endo-13-beta-D-glucosidase protein [Erysipelotrichaceae bacterium]|nr:MAG: Glucan endo-13-beta-D-glucosidase [Erysipelotrichaceae bacterium]TXT18397.1 MAG: Glucan endo-13-beta-D-glucosidase protein [Erysipelotrichaceae bacterium]